MIPKPSSSGPTITCLSLLKSADCTKPAAEKRPEAYGRWRSDQLSSAHQIERQLRSRWTLDALIESQLAGFDAHYNQSTVPSLPRDVPRLLFPSWNPPLENAALSWLGDWRPSNILLLIPILPLSSPLPPAAHRVLSEAARRLRVHEAVLDEEMAEYQSTSVLNLPFGRRRRIRQRSLRWIPAAVSDAELIGEEMRKMEVVMGRANRLRFRSLEVAVKRVLDRTQAAEFLVAFSGIQDLVHRRAGRWRARTWPVSIAVQDLEASPC